MCGRYASARKRQDLLEEFRIDRDRVTDDLEPDYNVAPTKPVYAVLTRGQRGDGTAGPGGDGRGSGPGAGQDVARELRVVRWGLVPFWAKDPSIGSRMINARVETVDAKPSFRSAFAKRRCLLPADGFYEWLKVAGPGQGPQAAVLHSPRRRRGARLRRAVRAVAGQVRPRRPPAGLAVDGRDHHHQRRGRGRPDPRPDADGHRPGPVGRLARPGEQRRRRTCTRCSRPRRRAGSRRTRWARTSTTCETTAPA